MRIVLPEIGEKVVAEAAEEFTREDRVVETAEEGLERDFDRGDVEIVGVGSLEEGAKLVGAGEADALVAGVGYTTREVVLACRDFIGIEQGRPGMGKTFSSCFLMTRGEEKYIIADAAVTKKPTAEQLYDIVIQTLETARILLEEEPRATMLSYSTLGSADKDPVLDKIREVTERLQREAVEGSRGGETGALRRGATEEVGEGWNEEGLLRGVKIVGEVQLDAALVPEVARKKGVEEGFTPANVLIVPDLTSGNILYKAMERFGGFTAAGPILQGFKRPCSDLSRGSSAKDVLAALEAVRKIVLDKSVKR